MNTSYTSVGSSRRTVSWRDKLRMYEAQYNLGVSTPARSSHHSSFSNSPRSSPRLGGRLPHSARRGTTTADVSVYTPSRPSSVGARSPPTHYRSSRASYRPRGGTPADAFNSSTTSRLSSTRSPYSLGPESWRAAATATAAAAAAAATAVDPLQHRQPAQHERWQRGEQRESSREPPSPSVRPQRRLESPPLVSSDESDDDDAAAEGWGARGLVVGDSPRTPPREGERGSRRRSPSRRAALVSPKRDRAGAKNSSSSSSSDGDGGGGGGGMGRDGSPDVGRVDDDGGVRPPRDRKSTSRPSSVAPTRPLHTSGAGAEGRGGGGAGRGDTATVPPTHVAAPQKEHLQQTPPPQQQQQQRQEQRQLGIGRGAGVRVNGGYDADGREAPPGRGGWLGKFLEEMMAGNRRRPNTGSGDGSNSAPLPLPLPAVAVAADADGAESPPAPVSTARLEHYHVMALEERLGEWRARALRAERATQRRDDELTQLRLQLLAEAEAAAEVGMRRAIASTSPHRSPAPQSAASADATPRTPSSMVHGVSAQSRSSSSGPQGSLAAAANGPSPPPGDAERAPPGGEQQPETQEPSMTAALSASSSSSSSSCAPAAGRREGDEDTGRRAAAAVEENGACHDGPSVEKDTSPVALTIHRERSSTAPLRRGGDASDAATGTPQRAPTPVRDEDGGRHEKGRAPADATALAAANQRIRELSYALAKARLAHPTEPQPDRAGGANAPGTSTRTHPPSHSNANGAAAPEQQNLRGMEKGEEEADDYEEEEDVPASPIAPIPVAASPPQKQQQQQRRVPSSSPPPPYSSPSPPRQGNHKDDQRSRLVQALEASRELEQVNARLRRTLAEQQDTLLQLEEDRLAWAVADRTRQLYATMASLPSSNAGGDGFLSSGNDEELDSRAPAATQRWGRGSDKMTFSRGSDGGSAAPGGAKTRRGDPADAASLYAAQGLVVELEGHHSGRGRGRGVDGAGADVPRRPSPFRAAYDAADTSPLLPLSPSASPHHHHHHHHPDDDDDDESGIGIGVGCGKRLWGAAGDSPDRAMQPPASPSAAAAAAAGTASPVAVVLPPMQEDLPHRRVPADGAAVDAESLLRSIADRSQKFDARAVEWTDERRQRRRQWREEPQCEQSPVVQGEQRALDEGWGEAVAATRTPHKTHKSNPVADRVAEFERKFQFLF